MTYPCWSDMPLLTVQKVSKNFGGVKAVNNLSLELKEGVIYGLIGPNGSGKTTLLNLINSIYRPDLGRIYLNGKDITGLPPHRVCRLGIGRTFQLLRIFPKLTALQNLLVIAPTSKGVRARTFELLERMNLTHLKDEEAGNLSYGQQKLLDFARVLMLDPKLLLLDEPFGGVNPVFIEHLIEEIRHLNARERKTFLIVEHNIKALMTLADYIFVMDYGEKIAEGQPHQVQNDERVLEAYFGR